MFHHHQHFDIWNTLHKHLKRADYQTVAEIWHASLPELAKNYDDLRMLYYIGRFGQREPYQAAANTLSYLRDSEPDILQYRLSIFRYTTENATISDPKVATWMVGDLAQVLGIPLLKFPAKKLPMPDTLAARLREINPPQMGSYTY